MVLYHCIYYHGKNILKMCKEICLNVKRLLIMVSKNLNQP